MALIALMAAEEGIMPQKLREWAQSQIHFMLGDGGRSYVVGFGKNPPQNPHHRARYAYVLCAFDYVFSELLITDK